MTFQVSPIADQVHGRKHTHPDIRDFICSLIKMLPHKSYVDPFAGSLTFALNSQAPTKFLGVLGVPESHGDVKVFGTDVWRMAEDWREVVLAAKKYTPSTRNSLLLLDPPRPRPSNVSSPYGKDFTYEDWDDLQHAAFHWPGPVILATYYSDISDWFDNKVVRAKAGWWSSQGWRSDASENTLAIYWRGVKDGQER